MRHVATVVVSIVVLGAVGLFLLGNLDALEDASLVYAVALVGTVGATANTYRKLQKLRHVTEDELSVPRALATGQIYLSPFIGAVFALVLSSRVHGCAGARGSPRRETAASGSQDEGKRRHLAPMDRAIP